MNLRVIALLIILSLTIRGKPVDKIYTGSKVKPCNTGQSKAS